MRDYDSIKTVTSIDSIYYLTDKIVESIVKTGATLYIIAQNCDYSMLPGEKQKTLSFYDDEGIVMLTKRGSKTMVRSSPRAVSV